MTSDQDLRPAVKVGTPFAHLGELLATRPPAKRVVVTGMGCVTSIGVNVPAFRQNVMAGRSGIKPIHDYNAAAYPTQIAGLVPEFTGPIGVPARKLQRMARFSQLAVESARQALLDAGLGLSLGDERAGVYIGSAVGGMDVTQEAVETMLAKGGMRISPFYIVMAPANLAAFHVAEQYQAIGYNNSCVTACAAGTQAIGEAAQIILRGDAELMLAGGTEAGLSELGLASFCVCKAFSLRNEEPERASRPFDIERDGFVGGEGSGIVVLERLDKALARGARIHAEVLGYGASNDAYHLIAPDPSAAGAVRAMSSALRSANLSPEAVDYVNAHATSTPAGDIAETLAIKKMFGERAYSVPVSATKSMIGHLFGAAGAVEAITTMLALRDDLIPPTINLDHPDPECDLDYVPHHARPAEIQVAISNSFGLGGQNAVVVLARYDGEGSRRALPVGERDAATDS